MAMEREGEPLSNSGAQAFCEGVQCCGGDAVVPFSISLWCFLVLPAVPAVPPVPVRATPPGRSSAQLGRAAGMVGAGCGGSPCASCTLAQGGLHRLVPHLLERPRVCCFTLACGSLPLQLRPGRGLCPVLPPCPVGG